MSKVKATIVEVSLSKQVPKRDGGTYEAYQIVYRDEAGRIKEFNKSVQGLKFKPKLKARLQDLKAGEEVSLVMEKNQGGYLELQDVELGHNDTTTNLAPPVGPIPTDKPVAKSSYVERTWETAQERSDKQRYIVRQSCLSNALSYFTLKDYDGVSKEELFDLAQEMEGWVFRKTVDDLVNDPIE